MMSAIFVTDYSLAYENYFIVKKVGSNKPYNMHFHDSYEIYYLLSGTQEYFVDDTVFQVNAGDFVFIPPFAAHRTGGNFCSRILIGFTPALLTETYSSDTIDYLLQCFNNTLLSPHTDKIPFCNAILRELLNADSQKTFSLHIGSLLETLLHHSESTIPQNKMSDILKYISSNLMNINSAKDIADHFHYSLPYFIRLFSQHMHITPNQYLNNIRIQTAISALLNTRETTSNIARLCGFNSSSYFSTVFKKYTGVSPEKFRHQSEPISPPNFLKNES